MKRYPFLLCFNLHKQKEDYTLMYNSPFLVLMPQFQILHSSCAPTVASDSKNILPLPKFPRISTACMHITVQLQIYKNLTYSNLRYILHNVPVLLWTKTATTAYNTMLFGTSNKSYIALLKPLKW